MKKRNKSLKIYNIKEAAEFLGISVGYMGILLRKRKVIGFKIGDGGYGHWRIEGEQLLKFVKR